MADTPTFVDLHPEFLAIRGEQPELTILADTQNDHGLTRSDGQYADGQANFHEACIYHALSRSVFVTSNQLPNTLLASEQRQQQHGIQPTGADKHVKLWRIYDNDTVQTPASPTSSSSHVDLKTFPGWEGALLNGGVNFGEEEILLCAQGSKNPNDLQGLIAVSISSNKVRTIIDSFYGIPFNSTNDVVVHPKDGTIWFTDPCYGAKQGIRGEPQLPNQVYRYDPVTKSLRVVADGFTRPNGLCFSPDLKTLYITDTGAIHGSADVPVDLQGPSHIYAFDIMEVGAEKHSAKVEPFLTNRRLFAYAPGRFPDGIKCDTNGNVYSGCGDGIEVWNTQGILIGIIKIPGGVANFCFGESGVIYACNETKFWKIKLKGEGVKGALLGL